MDPIWDVINAQITIFHNFIQVLDGAVKFICPGATSEQMAANLVNSLSSTELLSNEDGGICRIETPDTGSSANLQILIRTIPAGDPVFDSGLITGTD